MKTLDLEKFDNKKITISEANKKDIAIIGMSGKISSNKDLSDFWCGLVKGKDYMHPFSSERILNIRAFLDNQGLNADELRYSEASYLNEIDKFDYEFFSLSLTEANLISPNQRLFLETVWSAIEDAGYGGNKLSGTKTGVYVGFSTDSGGSEYRDFIRILDPFSQDISLPGNINSIIGSRISYLLDLKGPSMLIDTACSSSLTAVHKACQAIRNGECDTAIAGSINIYLIPPVGSEYGIGIQSSDGKTRAFDDNSDGIGHGEGVIAIVLKLLDKALEDGDQVYAVIKGSAVNQDGSSIGITAPSSLAQAEVITMAWQDAEINPETITYIETHGTGTKLGDPIEINGIQKAFQKFTSKKQFCAVGSVKTNIGHLDHAAGIAGLIKAVLALKNKEIPPSLHFERPNRKINFIDSPVYVNKYLKKWEVNGFPRRCGVSAFGLSGTNCHVVLEEAPERKTIPENQEGVYLLAISAKYQEGIIELAKSYRELIDNQPNIDLNNLCITANMGRGHYNRRLIILFLNIDDLKQKLKKIITAKSLESTSIKEIYFGNHKTVKSSKKSHDEEKFAAEEIKSLSNSVNLKIRDLDIVIEDNQKYKDLLEEICQLYIKGADIDWDELYKNKQYRKVSLPTYPFQKKRCWVEKAAESDMKTAIKEIEHPFFDRCIVDSIDCRIYTTKFSVAKHWVLSEHKVNGYHVPPGVVFLEIAKELGRQYFSSPAIELKEVVFLNLLVVSKETDKDVQIITRMNDGYFEFTIASKLNDDWVKHAEGKVYPLETKKLSKLDPLEIKQRCRLNNVTKYFNDEANKIEFGPRWDTVKDMYYGENEILVCLELPEKYKEDLSQFYLHPSLLDFAVNKTILTLAGFYLPWLYQSIKIYNKIPGKFYSYVRRKDEKNTEVATFDISLIDEQGNVFIEITDYMVKKVREAELRLSQLTEGKDAFYNITWVPCKLNKEEIPQKQGSVLVFKDRTKLAGQVINELRNQGGEIIEVRLGNEYSRIDNNTYTVGNTEDDYLKLMTNFTERNLTRIIHLQTLGAKEIENMEQLEEAQQRGVYSLYYLTRAILANRIKEELDIVLISDHVNKVTENEAKINPQQAPLFGLGKVVTQEYAKLRCRSIDIDAETNADEISMEIRYGKGVYQVAYRNGQRFVEEFQELDLNNISGQEIPIQTEGVYLITGGAGGLGLEFGKYLASKNKVNLALINRSGLPERNSWNEIITKNEDQKFIKKITAIQEMEKEGAEVSCYSADVSNCDEMKRILDELRRKYGKVNGIIHGAGVAGDGFIINKDERVFREVLAPKVQGTWIIDQLTQNDNPDFFVMFSSITALFGGPGQGDYTAANSFLDSYAAYRAGKGKKTLTINWPAWKETGMAVDYGANQDSVFKALFTKQALRHFEKAIKSNINRIFIGTLNKGHFLIEEFPIQMHQDLKWYPYKRNDVLDENNTNKKNNSIAINEHGNHEFNNIEQEISNVWARVLGLNTIDIYETFSNLGGNSILAVKLHRELEVVYPGLLDIADIFTYTTVKEMTEYVTQKITKDNKLKLPEGNDGFEELLEKLSKGEMTEEQIDKLL